MTRNYYVATASAIVPALIAALLFGHDPLVGAGQEKKPDLANAQKNVLPERGNYPDTRSCSECHSKPQPYQDAVFEQIICLCNEFEKWETTDKHRLAYAALKGKRATDMGDLLKIDVLNDRACVACHSVWIENAQIRTEKQSLINEGVSCIVCHGLNKGWVGMHASFIREEREDWREKKNRPEKHKFHGMTDLWDPVKRTRLCASCHIGNTEEGKVLTHEMYAVGHPPLPGFDMSNFSNDMRHWQYLSEKSEDVKKKFKITDSEAEFEQANLVYVGNLVGFETTLRLLASQVRGAWPEFAQFDCYACHHDLKADNWRQKRSNLGKPGRPQMKAWPIELVKLALRHSGGGDEMKIEANLQAFNAKLDKVRAAFDDQPFGAPDQVAAAALDLADWMQKQVVPKEASPMAITSAASKNMLAQLLESHKDRYLDFDAARQVAGAVRAFYSEGRKESDRDPDVMKQLKAIDAVLFLSRDSDLRLKHRENRLDITKKLAGMRKKNPANLAQLSKFLDDNMKTLEENSNAELEWFLKGVNQYDPESIQSKFKELAKAIGKKEKP